MAYSLPLNREAVARAPGPNVMLCVPGMALLNTIENNSGCSGVAMNGFRPA